MSFLKKVEAAGSYQVKIKWGSDYSADQEPVLYSFATQKELDAFLTGVEEAYGWSNYEIVVSDK